MIGGPVGAAAGLSAMSALTGAYKPAKSSGGFAPAVLTPTLPAVLPIGGPVGDVAATLLQKYGPRILPLIQKYGAGFFMGMGAAKIMSMLGGNGGYGYMGRLQRAIDIAEDAPPAIQARVFGAMMPHRHRGITYTELRGFRRVTSLLRSVGMRPKGLGRGKR